MHTDSGQEPTTIPATKLRRDLGAVLDAVLAGRVVHVERSGRPLCTLVPTAAYADLMERAEAAPEQH
jgi:prevent-host-death family protein